MSRTSITKRLARRLEVQRDTDTDVDIYVNKDTRPLPPTRRTYGPWEFVGLWMVTGSFNVGGWATGSSVISLGLNVWQAMLAIIIANTFVGLVCIAGGHPGAKWHIGFPLWMKQNWGIWGYLFPMAIRVFLSFVWTATNTWYGSQCLRVLLTCIWPSFLKLNTELANGAMKVYDFVAFIVYFLLCLPLIWFSPEKYKKPFLIASTTVATTVFVLLIWSVVRAGGGGALLANVGAVSGHQPAKGSALGWAFVAAVTANIGSIATHMWSQSDYTRYARKRGDQILAQLVMVPLGTIVVACIGIVCTSCAATLYPQEKKLLWQPYAFLDAIREHEGTKGARAGVAFASIAFMLAQFGMGVNITCLLEDSFRVITAQAASNRYPRGMFANAISIITHDQDSFVSNLYMPQSNEKPNMPPSQEPQRFDPLAPYPKQYATLIASYEQQAEGQRKEVEKLDKKFEALSEESKEAKEAVEKLQDGIAKASSAPR
ncbi:NCS1 nucleoside transporter, partial [Aureobasidium melanogenum]